MKIGVIHGPNLSTLGTREPEVYGALSLDDINRAVAALADELGVEVEFYQTNHEGEVVDHLAARGTEFDGFVVNPAAWTHTSVALRDALLATGRPFVEVHLSNTYARESFRHVSYLADVSAGVVTGFGVNSYLLGLRGLVSGLASA